MLHISIVGGADTDCGGGYSGNITSACVPAAPAVTDTRKVRWVGRLGGTQAGSFVGP